MLHSIERVKKQFSESALLWKNKRKIIIIFIAPIMRVMECWLSSKSGGDRQKVSNQSCRRVLIIWITKCLLHDNVVASFMIRGRRYTLLMNIYCWQLCFNVRQVYAERFVDLHNLLLLLRLINISLIIHSHSATHNTSLCAWNFKSCSWAVWLTREIHLLCEVQEKSNSSHLLPSKKLKQNIQPSLIIITWAKLPQHKVET